MVMARVSFRDKRGRLAAVAECGGVFFCGRSGEYELGRVAFVGGFRFSR
jgi:hypothetical protein